MRGAFSLMDADASWDAERAKVFPSSVVVDGQGSRSQWRSGAGVYNGDKEREFMMAGCRHSKLGIIFVLTLDWLNMTVA
jgi:hypothetical protein